MGIVDLRSETSRAGRAKRLLTLRSAARHEISTNNWPRTTLPTCSTSRAPLNSGERRWKPSGRWRGRRRRSCMSLLDW